MLSLAKTSGIKNAIVRQPHVLTKQQDREKRLKEKKIMIKHRYYYYGIRHLRLHFKASIFIMAYLNGLVYCASDQDCSRSPCLTGENTFIVQESREWFQKQCADKKRILFLPAPPLITHTKHWERLLLGLQSMISANAITFWTWKQVKDITVFMAGL